MKRIINVFLEITFLKHFIRRYPKEQQEFIKKTYKYYDQEKMEFKKIETGSIDSTQIITDQQEEKWLKYLGYTGLAFSIMLLPLGFTSIFGTILSVLSIALMAGSTIVQQLLENSIKITIDPNTAFYGNRFMVDGKTVWFRENGSKSIECAWKRFEILKAG